MNTQESWPPVTYMRNRRLKKTLFGVDLNVPPPTENRVLEVALNLTGSQIGPSAQQGGSLPLIDLEAFDDDDDDVIISSPSAFAEAKNKSRRAHGRANVVDVDSEGTLSRVPPNCRSKRRRFSANQTSINCDHYINLEAENVLSVTMPPPPPPPKEFTCPVCMGPFVEEISTKCGHIFCKKCIRAAIAAQNKCPTCRRKISMKDTIRVYLPAAN